VELFHQVGGKTLFDVHMVACLGVDDVLDLSDLLDANFTIGNQATYIQATTSGGDTTISIDGDGAAGGANFVDAAILQGVGISSSIDFIFDELGTQSIVVSA